MSAQIKAVKWAKAQVGTKESPPNSNKGPRISEWQKETARGGSWLVGAPWCGVFVENACRRAGVKTTSRWASVGFIEDDAKAKRGGFSAWHSPRYFNRVRTGTLVVLFGRGVHVEIVRSHPIRYLSLGLVLPTVGGNTSSGNSGSQSNGGGVYKRFRFRWNVHGFAIPKYPGS